MTYKALRRKEDKQWMTFGDDNLLITSSFPVKALRELDHYVMFYPYNDWSLYELVTVHCIAEDELPSDEKIESEIVDLFGKNDISVGIIAGIKAYKSKILKP